MDTKFNCLPTIIGSLPFKDPAKACDIVTHYLKDIPAWPQLPKRTYVENMFTQYTEGFPGIIVENDKTFVDRRRDTTKALEEFYTEYFADDFSRYGISQEYAAGLYKFLTLDKINPRAIKGHVTGPVTLGLTITDETGKGIIYDDTFGDVVPKFLKLKARWMEETLREFHRDTIIFIDEPSMSSFGSVGMQLTREQVVSLLTETLSGIKGLKGVHCCGNTDWSIILQTPVDILNCDTYNYPDSLAIYADGVVKFVAKGGAVAWGIVPTTAEAIMKESVASLKDRWEEAITPFTKKGIPFKSLLEHSLLTPACGLGTVNEQAAERALQLLADLSQNIRSRYL